MENQALLLYSGLAPSGPSGIFLYLENNPIHRQNATNRVMARQ